MNQRQQFPLTQKFPHRESKLIFKAKDFKQLIKSELNSKLKEIGFSASADNIFIRDRNTHYELILFGGSKYGGAISIDSAVKFKPPFSDIDLNLKNLWPFGCCESYIRLSPDDEDNWWTYRDTREENIAVISEMWSMIQLIGLPYLKRFENLTQFLDSIVLEEISTEKLFTNYKLVRHEPSIYFSLIQNCILRNEFEKAITLAKKGLTVKNLNDDYRVRFEQFLKS